MLLIGSLGWLSRRGALLALFVILLATNTALDARGAPRETFSLGVKFMTFFAAGSVLYLYRDRIVYTHRLAAVLAVLLAAASRFPLTGEAGLAVCGAYLIVWFALAVPSKRLAAVGSRHDLSYGVYLYGWPIQSTLIWLVPGLHPLLVAAATSLLASGCAVCSWQWIERPALQLKGRWIRRQPVVARESSR